MNVKCSRKCSRNQTIKITVSHIQQYEINVKCSRYPTRTNRSTNPPNPPYAHPLKSSTTVKHRSTSKHVDCTGENKEEHGGSTHRGFDDGGDRGGGAAARKEGRGSLAGVRRAWMQRGAARRATEGAGSEGFRRRHAGGYGGSAGENGCEI
jgi:hypothetical protein